MSFDPVTAVIDVVGRVADKIWPDANEREKNKAALAIGVMEAKARGDLAEYQAEAERWKDIREGGWLSRQVRPVISLTFHFFFWYAFLFWTVPEFTSKIGTVIFDIWEVKVTVGAVYVLVICFYFLTKGIKDWFISKNPLPK